MQFPCCKEAQLLRHLPALSKPSLTGHALPAISSHLAFVDRDSTMQFSMATAGITSSTMPPVARPYLAYISVRVKLSSGVGEHVINGGCVFHTRKVPTFSSKFTSPN